MGILVKAERRAERLAVQVRGLLAAGDSAGALTMAVQALRGEAAKVRQQRPADGLLADADLAASLVFIASHLHGTRPPRPAGCPAVPGPADLVAAFDATLGRYRQEGRDSD